MDSYTPVVADRRLKGARRAASRAPISGQVPRKAWGLRLLLLMVVVWLYVSYLMTSVCPSAADSHAPAMQWSDAWAYPTAINEAACFGIHHTMAPFYDAHVAALVEPHWEALDTKFGLARKWKTGVLYRDEAITKLQALNLQWGVSSSISEFAHDSWVLTRRNLAQINAVAKLQWHTLVWPLVQRAITHILSAAYRVSDFAVVQWQKWHVTLSYHYAMFHASHILPNYLKAHRYANHHIGPLATWCHLYYVASHLDIVVDYVKLVLELLYTRGNDIYKRKLQARHHSWREKWQTRHQFLRDEWYSLIHYKPTDDAKVKIDESIVEVVKEALEDIGELPLELKDKFESSVQEIELDSERDGSVMSDSEEEPLTVKVTSTITVVSNDKPSDVAANAVDLPHDSLVASTAEDKIEAELLYWRDKVNKTCTLAVRNLDRGIDGYTNTLLESEIKPSISEILTHIQQTNYEAYKRMNSMISNIEKDCTNMKELQVFIRSQADEDTFFGVGGNTYVSRQDIRDEIGASKGFVQEQVDVIKASLTEYNSRLIEEYFRQAQDVIDILESFAELTILEFSTRLHTLLSILEQVGQNDDDGEVNWKAWREFHKIKESIYKTRDHIFDQAHKYKSNFLFENEDAHSVVIPQGFAKWEEYLQSIHFHANFLINDNGEYLGLVRAKANLAFQLRTQTEYELEELFENQAREEEQDEGEQIDGLSNVSAATAASEASAPVEDAQPLKEPQPISANDESEFDEDYEVVVEELEIEDDLDAELDKEFD